MGERRKGEEDWMGEWKEGKEGREGGREVTEK